MRERVLLVVTDPNADDLAMRMASSALYAAWGKLALEFTEGAGLNTASADVALAYEAVYRLGEDGDLQMLAGHQPRGSAAFSYTTVVARPDNFSGILRAQARRAACDVLDGLQLKAAKNEWIEAGFTASVLAACAPCPASRRLVLLPGKNYQLDHESELFEAVLQNGVAVESSDLRCYYFLREAIMWERANFTRHQLDEVAKLPATLTPVYVHGNGDVTLSAPFAPEMAGELRFRDRAAALRYDVACAAEGGFARLAGLRKHAAALLGQPQPGDALELVHAA